MTKPANMTSVHKRSMRLYACAKVNLVLRVGPIRPDGYHNIQTVFQQISLHDTLTFSLQPSQLTLQCSALDVPRDDSNLVIQALRRLGNKLRVRRGLHVTLDKQIPVGAGLGGGSSDAASALWAGYCLWTRQNICNGFVRPQWGQVPPILKEIASQLGADVPFFLSGGRAWADGIGDKLTPLPTQTKRWMVLVYPRVHVATPMAYRLLDKVSQSYCYANSFEPVILRKFTAVRIAHRQLQQEGCQDVMLSGSGSSVFGWVSDRSSGQQIVRRLQSRPWDIFIAHTI